MKYWRYSDKYEGRKVVFDISNRHSFPVDNSTTGKELAETLNEYHEKCRDLRRENMVLRIKKEAKE